MEFAVVSRWRWTARRGRRPRHQLREQRLHGSGLMSEPCSGLAWPKTLEETIDDRAHVGALELGLLPCESHELGDAPIAEMQPRGDDAEALAVAGPVVLGDDDARVLMGDL